MASRFVRNIRDTNLGGSKLRPNDNNIEPLHMSIQNDILSDDEDVFIHNNKEYVCLTDNIKVAKSTDGGTIRITDVNKNEISLAPVKSTKEQAELGTNSSGIMTPQRTKQAIDVQVPIIIEELSPPVKLNSLSPYVTVTRNGLNDFTLDFDYQALLTQLQSDLGEGGSGGEPQ